MDPLERVLKENSGRLIRELTGEVGLTEREAEVFLEEAGRALVESYRWHAAREGEDQLGTPEGVKDVLAGISGRELARRVGLSSARTWDGLRTLVPAVVRGGPASGVPLGGHAPGR